MPDLYAVHIEQSETMESQHDVRGRSGVMISQPELLDCLVVLRDLGCRNACLSCVGDN